MKTKEWLFTREVVELTDLVESVNKSEKEIQMTSIKEKMESVFETLDELHSHDYLCFIWTSIDTMQYLVDCDTWLLDETDGYLSNLICDAALSAKTLKLCALVRIEIKKYKGE